jgi:hypothetical protein
MITSSGTSILFAAADVGGKPAFQLVVAVEAVAAALDAAGIQYTAREYSITITPSPPPPRRRPRHKL